MIDALGSERRLIDELIGLMRRQRAAVGADDLQGVEETVYAMQRVLCTLGEARKRRRALNVRFGHAEDLKLRDLENALGPSFTPHVHEARKALQRAAQTLSGEVAVNRRVLREALAASDEYVRALLGGGMPPRDPSNRRISLLLPFVQPPASPEPPSTSDPAFPGPRSG